MKIAVIGLGIIGIEVFKEIQKKINGDEILGVEIDSDKVKNYKAQGLNVIQKIDTSQDVYVICVYTTEQVKNVINSLDYSRKPLVSIESTIKPGTYKELVDFVVNKNKSNLLLFPHRLNSNDPEHHIFNQKRLIAGATEKCLERGIKFYSRFMSKDLFVITSPEYAELCKPLENAIRFVEIATAEEIKIFCDEKKLDFNEVMKCVNSKWNMNLKEARDGIEGKCLPKDSSIINDFFKKNLIFNSAIKLDKRYKKK
jgi:UDP-N-acetyl-D-mannosaminuronate dehydrogenase